MAVSIKRLSVSLIKRNAIKRGPTSSDAWNDSFEETVNDLSRFVSQWNDSLYPLLSSLPDGTNDLNAFENGLDGRTILVDNSAVSTVADTTYFNIAEDRPNSLREQFSDVYTSLTQLQQSLESQIANASGALTDGQKEAIGAHVFDEAETSSATSIDGKAESNRLNLIQVAKDVYGTGFALDNDGTANLTNSVMAMVDALLELHNGNWDNDVALNHDGVFDTTDFVLVDGSNALTGNLRIANGLVTAPALTFDSDQNTGIYRSAEGQIAFTANSVEIAKFDGTSGALLIDKIRGNVNPGIDIDLIEPADGTLDIIGQLDATSWIQSDWALYTPRIGPPVDDSEEGGQCGITFGLNELDDGLLIFNANYGNNIRLQPYGDILFETQFDHTVTIHSVETFLDGNLTVSGQYKGKSTDGIVYGIGSVPASYGFGSTQNGFAGVFAAGVALQSWGDGPSGDLTTWRDPAGNHMMKLQDGGSIGNLVITGDLTVSGGDIVISGLSGETSNLRSETGGLILACAGATYSTVIKSAYPQIVDFSNRGLLFRFGDGTSGQIRLSGDLGGFYFADAAGNALVSIPDQGASTNFTINGVLTASGITSDAYGHTTFGTGGNKTLITSDAAGTNAGMHCGASPGFNTAEFIRAGANAHVASTGNIELNAGAGAFTTSIIRGGLAVGGGVTAVKTGTYVATVADYFIPCDTAAIGAFTVTLPAASAAKGQNLFIKTAAISPNHVTVARAGADTITTASGVSAVSFTLNPSSSLPSAELISDGTSIWYVV